VDRAAIPITRKLLAGAGGWPALKIAQELQRADRVSDAQYESPVLSGMVREGNRNLRSGLRVKSATDVENLCTCRESREWGTICAHALAVGLAYIERESAEVTAPTVAEPAITSKPDFVEIGTADATPVALHFILPPQFDSAWAKNQIMIVIETELAGKRTMLSALSTSEVYGCDTFDLVAIDGLNQLAGSGELLAALRILSREDFLRLLHSLRGHPRVTFGKSIAVEISQTHYRPKVLLQPGNGDEIVLRLAKTENEQLLVGETEAWSKNKNRLTPCIEGLPAEFLALANGPLTLRGKRALRFLAFEAARLEHWLAVEIEEGLVLPKLQKASPQFTLNVEGSMRVLRAELQCQYADGPIVACAVPSASDPLRQRTLQLPADTSFYRNPKEPNVIFLRDFEAEAAAVRRLESYGFTPEADQFVVRKENQIARFFAFEYPRLKTEWKITLSAQAEKCSGELQPLAPAIDIVASGENWFELRYSLASPNGETVAANELQRLLRSGQNQTRLRNGRAAVFDAEAVTDFEEVLRDCEPSQSQPGVYRIDRAHARYIAATAQEAGAHIADLRGALERFASDASASQVETLKANLGNLGNALREYQLHGVAWLGRLAESGLGGILADEMGLGKTVQTLAFLSARKSSQPALIVCPSSLLTNWRNEAQRFTPELKVLVLEGPSRHERFAEIGQADIVITSYALMQRDAGKYQAIEFSSAILDEAQHIKNPETQNAQTAFALRAQHRFVLTGTPIENSVRDLWSLMNFAVPGYLGSRSDFRERYEQPLARGPAPEVQHRLARRIRPFLLRRKKTEVAKDLPEKIEQMLSCDLSSAQRSTYDGLLREIQLGVPGGSANAAAMRMKMLLGLLRLRQVCCDLRLLGAAIANESDTSTKLELLEELLEEAIDGGHRVLVFSQFVAMLSLIRQRLESKSIAFAYLDGQTKDRQSVVDRFQTDNSIPVFLMSLKAGGVGLNLSAADTVIHFDPWWNYAAEAQATDRAHRIGQTRIVTAYKLIARDTVEEKIVKLQARKRAASEGTIGSEEPLMSGLTTEDLEELLS
jgi:superfamily II DNA or RNA helicase